jgi:penicillin-binding protein 2
MRFHSDENIAYLQQRITGITLAIFLFFVIVVARLVYLQIYQGSKYQKLATDIFVREEEIVAKRGDILDRNGNVLANTRRYFEITLTPQYVKDKDQVIASLTQLLPITASDIEKKLTAAKSEPAFRPVVIVEDAPYDWVARLSERLAPEYDPKSTHDFTGVSLRSWPLRQYLHPELFSHALGYLTEIDKTKLEKQSSEFPGLYSRGDLIGAAGIENFYDLDLRGRDGVAGRVVDARGQEVKLNDDLNVLLERANLEPLAGHHLKTTLDYDAQQAASEFYQDKKGAVVALDPNTGEIIVLYSSPGYDANRITKKIDKDYWQLINLNPDKYLFNRATQAMYPPASTYKAVALAGGIASGIIDPVTTRFVCHGGLHFGNRFFKCWNKGGHGTLDAVHGMGQSCDVFFYNLGLKLGVNGLAQYAHEFGLGSKTGIDMPSEKAGLIPTAEWKERVRQQKWIESETLSIAIGQGYDLVTPLQNAVVAAMVANGGYRVTPHLGLAIEDGNHKKVRTIFYTPMATALTNSAALEWVKKGMIEVVHGNGTAKKLKNSHYKIAGKTGTAQVIGHDSQVKLSKNTESHALFIAFAPYDDPKIAVSVIVEHGKGGSLAAAPVAQKVIDTYLAKIMPISDTQLK